MTFANRFAGRDPFDVDYRKEPPKKGLLSRFASSVSTWARDEPELAFSLGLVGATAIAATIAVAAFVMQVDNGRDALHYASRSAESSQNFLLNAHRQFAIGAHSGMMIAGVEFSSDTDARIAEMREDRVVHGRHQESAETALLEMRALGAIAGGQGFGESDLIAYLDHLDDLSSGLKSISAESGEQFNAIPGISKGESLANVAKAIAIMGDDMIADGSVDDVLNSIVLSSFDKGHSPSLDDMTAVRSLILETVSRFEDVAKTDAALVAASSSLVKHQTSVFGGRKISTQAIVTACPFEGPLTANPALTTEDDDCRPG